MISAHFEKGRCYFGAFNKETDTNPETGRGGVDFFRFKAMGYLLSKIGLAYKVDYQKGEKHGIVYIKPSSFKSWLQRHQIVSESLDEEKIESLIQQVCKENPKNLQEMESGDFVALGNSKLSDAEVFCLTEEHGNENDAKRNGELINKYYRPGDLIYIEGVERGKSGTAGQYYMTRFVNPDYLVQGWEPQNYRELTPFASEWDEMADKLSSLIHLSNPEGMIDQFREIAKYVEMDDKEINRLIKIMQSMKTNEELKFSIAVGSAKLEELLDKKYIALMKGKTISAASIIKRNDSICEVLSENKKVRKFIIMGTAHPLNLSRWSSPADKLQSELQKHPHVICVDRHHFKKGKLGKLNPNLSSL